MCLSPKSSTATFALLLNAPWVDRLYLYDNSIDGAEAAPILRATEGKITKLYQLAPEWMAPILEVLEKTP